MGQKSQSSLAIANQELSPYQKKHRERQLTKVSTSSLSMSKADLNKKRSSLKTPVTAQHEKKTKVKSPFKLDKTPVKGYSSKHVTDPKEEQMKQLLQRTTKVLNGYKNQIRLL